MDPLPPPDSSFDILSHARNIREDSDERTRLDLIRYLHIISVLGPAALSAASAGNVTMRNAVAKIAHLLPKSTNTSK